MLMNRKAGIFVLLAIAFFTLAPYTGLTLTPNETDAAAGNVLWGAHLYGLPPEAAAFQPGGRINRFINSYAKKNMSIIAWGAPWEYPVGTALKFQTAYFDNVSRYGAIPMLDWGAFAPGGPNQTKYKLTNVYSGYFDAFITNWATAAKAWGKPFFLRFNWEMNGNWQFPWSSQLNGNTPADYVKAWRHVRDIFTRVGANNVTWVWSPNISTWNTVPLSQVYPGNAYVDWVALDGYNWAGYQSMPWLNFGQIYAGDTRVVSNSKNSLAEIAAVAPGKPLMIAEFASVEAGDGGTAKANWITNALLVIGNNPNIKAIVWFNHTDGGMTWPIESSTASMNAFATAISNPLFLGNVVGNLPPGKIQPRR